MSAISFIKNKWILLIFIVTVPFSALSQTLTSPDGTQGDPFLTLDVQKLINGAGTYYFDIDGVTFRTFVDADGYIAVYADVIPINRNDSISSGGIGVTPRVAYIKRTDTFSNPITSSDLDSGKGYLNATILVKMSNAVSLKVTEFPVPTTLSTRLNAWTSNQTLINRVLTGVTLSRWKVDNSLFASIHWSGTGVSYMQGSDSTNNSAIDLRKIVFHSSGNLDGIHWRPNEEAGFAIDYTGDDIYTKDGKFGSAEKIGDERLDTGSQIMLLLWFGKPVLRVQKVASASNGEPAKAGDVITYTYYVENVGTLAANNVTMNDLQFSEGAFVQPNIENATLTNTSGISSNTDTTNDSFDVLGPDDELTVTATYTVTEDDMAKYGDK